MSVQSIMDDLPIIVCKVLDSKLSDWTSYHFNNGDQDLDRMSLVYLDYEVQLNQIRIASKSHSHSCNMVSRILCNGYKWYLRQEGALVETYLYAAPGSIITMGPNDGHRILRCEKASLSLCVFDKIGGIHTHYKEWEKLSEDVSFDMLRRAKEVIL